MKKRKQIGSTEGAGARIFYVGAPIFLGEGGRREREHGFFARFRTLRPALLPRQRSRYLNRQQRKVQFLHLTIGAPLFRNDNNLAKFTANFVE